MLCCNLLLDFLIAFVIMENLDATLFCDDEDNCLDNEWNSEYDYDYSDTSKETLHELYQYCLSLTLYDTGYYLLPLFGSAILFRIFLQIRKILSLHLR